MDDFKKIFIIFFGPPGSGKGTQVDMLAGSLELPVISTGELLRQEEEIGSPIGLEVRNLVDSGQMVPDATIEFLIDRRLGRPDVERGAVFDGYPRRIEQQENLINRLGRLTGPADTVLAVLINVSDEMVEERLTGRRVCDCGASYHIKYNPPKADGICDLCGKKITTRPDDQPEIIKERLAYYHEHIKPLLDYWREKKSLIIIDGEKDIDAIKKEIMQNINLRLYYGHTQNN
jgi:adenylate kinase